MNPKSKGITLKKPKAINLGKYERIIAVVPQLACGPGWSNKPVWVYIEESDGRLRTECLQPEQQTMEMRQTLFGLEALMHQKLVAAVPVKGDGK